MEYQVAIVGGGLIGPLLSTALARAGLHTVIIDAAPAKAKRADDFDGRAYALSAASVAALEALGIWEGVQSEAQPILDIRVGDGEPGRGAGPITLHFDHNELDGGPMGHMLEDRFLRRALLDAAATAGVETRAERRVTAVADGVLTLDSGQTLTANLVVGCDGRRSTVAELAGIRRHGWDYEQSSLVCAVEHQEPHDGTAWQLFTQSGPLAVLPLRENKSSIVWTEKRDRAEQISAMDDAGYLEALEPVFGDFLGPIRLVGERYRYPLGLSLAASLTGPRLALAGDAAHGIHPLAGQGLNLGIRDVAALAEVVVNAARLGRDIGAKDVLSEYARWRRFDIAAMAATTDGINRVFSTNNPLMRGIRSIGLAAVGAAPDLRRTIMRQAAGLAGERPRLLRGLSL